MNVFKKGFTIIELIVVVAIIAVLAGIVMVNVTNYIAKAKVVRMVADFNNMSKAVNLYFADEGVPPPREIPSNHYNDDRCERYWSRNYVSWPKSPFGYYQWYYLWTGNPYRFALGADNIPQNIAQMIDDQIDDGNFTAGRVRFSSGILNYADFEELDTGTAPAGCDANALPPPYNQF